MTEERSVEAFEAKLTRLARSYTDGAAARPYDDLAAARLAMSARVRRWSPAWRMRGGELGPRVAGVPWLALGAAVTIAVLIAVAVDRTTPRVQTGQPTAVPSAAIASPAVVGPLPTDLLHPWQRPYGVTPDLGRWGSGTLVFTDGALSVASDLLDLSSTSKVDPGTTDELVVAATDGTMGCEVGDAGTYRWEVTGSGTVLTLTVRISDGCKVREQALVGDWVRSDMTGTGFGVTMPAGDYQSMRFDPLGRASMAGGLSFRLPDGWVIAGESDTDVTLLHPQGDGPQPVLTTVITVMARPTLVAPIPDEAPCGAVTDQEEGGTSVDELLAALAARPGVEMSSPTSIEIRGHPATVVDLRLAPDWTGACKDGTDSLVGIALLRVAGQATGQATGPLLAVTAQHPFRLVLVDLGEGRTVAIAAFGIGDDPSAVTSIPTADAMPVIESFEFQSTSGN